MFTITHCSLFRAGCKTASHIDVSSEQALRRCSDADTWSEFGAQVLEAAEKVDLSPTSTSVLLKK